MSNAMATRAEVDVDRERILDEERTAATTRGQALKEIQLTCGDIQAKGNIDRDAEVHAEAGRGIAGAAATLPHLDQIQRSFGRYDVRDVEAHVGGEAADACEAMGAEAYATGNHVAFGRNPDLHTTAHEAAHVVQQRAGVHFAGGVGREGDAYERHADAVADAVVAGEPAEHLLAQMAPAGGAAGGAVQMRRQLPKGEGEFHEMWEAHPHNDGEGGAADTSDEELRGEHGLPEAFQHTCAIRLSIMLNGSGERITPARVRAAGIERPPHYSRTTKQYYLRAASEVLKYLTKFYRKADVIFPPDGGRYKAREDFEEVFKSTIRPAIEAGKGIVAFEKLLTGYTGSGHMDVFDGMSLSDSEMWYPCQRLHLWYVAVP